MEKIDIPAFRKRLKVMLVGIAAGLALFVPAMLILFKCFRSFGIDNDAFEMSAESIYVLAWVYLVSRLWLAACPKCGRYFFLSDALKRTKTEGFFDWDFWKKCGHCGLTIADRKNNE